MRKMSLALLSAVAILSPALVMAAPATDAEAQRLTGVLESYLGSSAPGEPPRVSVSPRGEQYVLSFDLAQILKPLARWNVSVEAQPLTMTITPQDGGMWKVEQSALPDMRMRFRQQDMSMRFDNLRFEGLYDSNLMAFVYGQTTHAGVTVESRADKFTNTRREGPSKVVFTGVDSGGGQLSASVKGQTASMSQTFSIQAGAAPIELRIATGAITQDIVIDSLSNAKLLDIWKFLVANAPNGGLDGKLDDLKAHVRAALPLFKSLAQTGKVEKVEVATPFGRFAMRDFTGALKLTGVHQQGDAGVRIAFNGLEVPQAIVPPWARDFVPGELILDLRANGYDLAAVADELLNIARPGVPQDESKAAGLRALQRLAPDGKVKVALGPTRIVSKILTVDMEGEMTVFKPVPKGRLVVKAKGLDEAIAALQPVANGDPNVQKALMGMIAARGFGKNGANGELVWEIANPDGGLPTINGVSIPNMGRR